MKSSNFTTDYNITTMPRGMVYTIKSGEFRNIIVQIICVLVSLMFAVALVQTFKWYNRHKKWSSQGATFVHATSLIFQAIICICHTFSYLIFPFTLGLSSYWIVLVKILNNVFVLSIDRKKTDNNIASEECQALVVVFKILFWTHTLYMLSKFYKQCNIDIFFIDWEKSRGMSTDVSMWRLVMISKEWNQLYMARKTRIEINIVLLIFIMNSVMKANIFREDFPTNENLGIISNIIFSVWIWTCTTLVQYIIRKFIVERFFIQSKSQHFIDFSTLAKISTFIMDEDYDGYYIHCRSPYEFADCSYEDLLEYMERESQGLYTQRGMDDPAAPRNCQAFTIVTSAIFRRQVDKALKSSNRTAARTELSSFLKSFIEQTPPPLHEGLRRKVQKASLVKNIMGLVHTDVKARESGCVIYPDEPTCISDYSFLNMTFNGSERDLFLQDILTYCFILTIRNEMGIAVLFTYIMNLIRQNIIIFFGQRNISRKAFIDARLL